MKKLILYTTGGLCNCLRPISSSVKLAQILNRELLIFQEPNFRMPINFNELFDTEHKFIYADDLMKLENCCVSASEYDIKQEQILFGRSILRTLVNNDKNRICPVGPDAIDDTIEDENIVMFSSYFLRQVEMIEVKNYLKALKPKKEIQEKIDSLAKKYKINKDVIGCHVRGSDINCSVQEYDKKLRRLNDTRKIFVCSDDKGYEDYFVKRYKKRVIRIEKDNYSFKQNKNNQSWIDNTTMTREAVIEGVIDLYLLSKTDIRVYFDKSSYAQIALLMSK